MKTIAKKYTYEKPRFITSPYQDYTIQPEVYRRYVSYIAGFYIFFFLVFSFGLNLFLDQIFYLTLERSFNILRAFKFLLGHEDDENKILYAIVVCMFFGPMYLPIKKLVFNCTKPVNRVEIEEGLYLIEGSNVFEQLNTAFEEMNNQQ